jgi:hypothetical protein
MAGQNEELSVRAHLFQNAKHSSKPFVVGGDYDIVENDQSLLPGVLGQQFS